MAGATQKYRGEKYGKEAMTDQWGQVRKRARKEHVYAPLPSIREAVFVGKGEEGRREKERKKQASKLLYPLFTPPKTDPQNSKVPLYGGSPQPLIRGREETRAKVALAQMLLLPAGASSSVHSCLRAT